MLNKIIYTILGIGIAFIFFPHAARDSSKRPAVSGIATQKDDAAPEQAAPEMAINLSAPILTAHSAVAFDLNSGTILYSKNLDDKLPIASLTKLMSAIVVVEKANLNETVLVHREDLLGIGSTIGLVAGERITVSDLLKGMLVPSGNDAALVLARHVAGSPEKFAEFMNEKAQELNLVATHFSNPAGWDSWADKENFSNALDLIKVTKAFLSYKELRDMVLIKEATVFSVDGRYSHYLRTTNKLLLEDPNVAGIKTGFTSKALGNLIIQYNAGDISILSIVLDSENREEDSRKLLDWILRVYKW